MFVSDSLLRSPDSCSMRGLVLFVDMPPLFMAVANPGVGRI
jgi:hypothetical protein